MQYILKRMKITTFKAALTYGVTFAAAFGLIAFFNSSNLVIKEMYPDFPFWLTPLISAVIIEAVGIIVWRKIRQADILKEEFITTAAHKFRTPLTHIKWASENLNETPLKDDQKIQLGYIREGADKLVELTNILMNVSTTDDNAFDYHMRKTDLSSLVDESAAALRKQAAMKGISLKLDVAPGIRAVCDASRIRFVIQTFIENAVHYTQKGGSIEVSLALEGSDAVYSVRDSGIGIDKAELPLLFSKFYRTVSARSTDTEGMGIGLFVSKGIVSRHRGKISAQSEGAGKGSIFSFSLSASLRASQAKSNQ